MIITKNQMDMLAFTPVEFNHLKTFAKTRIIPARQNQSIQKKNIFSNAPVRRFAIPMNTNSPLIGSYTENQLWNQQFDLRKIRQLTAGQPIIAFEAADNCRLYLTTLKAMNFQDDIPSIPFEIAEDQYVLVFDLTSMPHATELFH